MEVFTLLCLCWPVAMALFCSTSALVAGKVKSLTLSSATLTNMTCSPENDAIWEENWREYPTKCMGPKVKYLEVSCYSHCNGRVQLKRRFHGRRFTAPSKNACFDQCALNESSEVVEFNTGDNQCICGTSNLRARYFAFVPRRYLACNSSASLDKSLMYREDRLHDNLTAIGQAYLFYALDEVSAVDNIASRDRKSTDAVWNGLDRNKFDCAPLTSDGPKALTLFSVDKHSLATPDILDLSSAQGFTMMAWAKRRAPLIGGEEMILTSYGSNTCTLSHKHNYPNKFYYSVPGFGGPTPKNSMTVGSWNHVAIVVAANNTVQVAVDGELSISTNMRPVPQTYRQLFIGSSNRIGNSWDGCLAHAVLFQRELSIDEIKVVSAIFSDENF